MNLAKGVKRLKSVFVVNAVMLFLGIVPMWLLGTTIYQMSLDSMSISSSSSLLDSVRFFAHMIQNEVDGIQQRQNKLLTSDANLIALAYSAFRLPANEFRYLQNLYTDLDIYVSSSPLIEDVTAYLPKLSKKQSLKHGFSEISEQDSEFIHALYETSPDGISLTDELILVYGGFPLYSKRNPVFPNRVLVTKISNARIKTLLESFISETSQNDFAIYNDIDHTVFASTFEQSRYDSFIALEESENEGSYVFLRDGDAYISAWTSIPSLEMTLYQILPQNVVFSNLSDFQRRANMIRLVVVIVTVLLSAVLCYIIYSPLQTLRKAFRRVQEGNLDQHLGTTWSNEFNELFGRFNEMEINLQGHIEQEYDLRLLATNAQLKQLQYQINPHFLYNTYFILRGLLTDEFYDKASSLSELLGTYMKYIVYTDEMKTPLKNETGHARTYTAIQKMRFERRMTFEFDPTPSEMENILVPRLIIQPLIENVFEHGIKNSVQGGFMRISFRIVDPSHCIEISVEDNGSGITDESIAALNHRLMHPDGTNVALANIHQRLRLVYGPQSGLIVSRSDLGGLCVIIHIEGGNIEYAPSADS